MYDLGDIVEMKAACLQANRWQIIRMGADIKIVHELRAYCHDAAS